MRAQGGRGQGWATARACLGGLAAVEEAASELGHLLVVELACKRRNESKQVKLAGHTHVAFLLVKLVPVREDVS